MKALIELLILLLLFITIAISARIGYMDMKNWVPVGAAVLILCGIAYAFYPEDKDEERK